MSLKIGNLLRNRYEIKKILKRFGPAIFCAVYLAYDQKMGRRVVIKALTSCPLDASPTELQNYEQAKARFNRELEALNGITDPNVIILYNAFEQDGVEYMVLEYLSGGTLANLLKEQQKLDWSTAQRLGLEICHGLRAIHSADGGTLHLDITPSNIFLRKRIDDLPETSVSWAVIGDLGEARLLDNKKTKIVILDSDFVGTPGYIAPEIQEKRTATYQSDIYSLGIVLFEALTGKRFQNAGDFLEESLHDIPKAIAEVILKAIRPSRKARFQTASEMYYRLIYARPQEEPVPLWRTTLEALLIGIPTTYITEFVIQATSLIPLSLSVLALLTILGLGYYWRKEPDKERFALGIGALIAILSVATAFVFRPPLAPPPNTPTVTPTVTLTATLTATPDQKATDTALKDAIIAAQEVADATRTASAATLTASAPTLTYTPLPTHTPTPTATWTPTPTMTDTPTIAPPPPPSSTFTPTPTPTPVPEGIFSFSALVNGRYQTYIYNLATSNPTPLYIHDGAVDADIQPGGKLLAYKWADTGKGGIWRMDLDGSDQHKLTDFVEDRAPNWSADGEGIFLSSTRGGDRIHRIFRINADGSGEIRFPEQAGRDPVELAGGQLLFAGWLSYDPGACGVVYYQWSRKGGAGDIVGTEGRISDQCSDFRPDAIGGQIVFMRQESGQFDIWRNQVTQNVEHAADNITPNTPTSNEILPIFSPDGQWIAFASDRGGGWNVYVMKSDRSGEPAILLDIPPNTNFSDWNLSRLSWAN